VALRLAWVWDPGMYQRIEAQWQHDPGSEWTPTWEYGQFVDVRDVAATSPSLTMTARFAPPVRDPASFQREPRRSLFDYRAAARVLGWAPRYGWAARP
jgi:hypothetical protein